MRRLFLISWMVAGFLCMCSCAGVKNVTYMQNFDETKEVELPEISKIKASVGDRMTIIVHSKDPDLAMMFNMPIVAVNSGQLNPNIYSATGNNCVAYSIDDNGDIDFPVIGKIHVLGMTRTEIGQKIKELLIERKLIMDPVVTVDFSDMYVSVIGDVQKPGRYAIDKDRITVIDMLSKAGDLNVTGVRTNVSVYREVDGKQVCYKLDFTDADSVFQSPAYYLRQDDVVYVQPNRMKARSSTVNGNNLLSTSFWISVASLATSVLNLVMIYFINKKQ